MASVPEPKNVIYGLFCECHPERGIRYVGQTSQGARKRRYHHVNRAKGGADYAVSRWIRKHLPENIGYFTLEVLDDPRDLDRLEEWWIAELGTFTGDRGLNMSMGGKSIRGYKHTEGTREGLRGRVYTEATRTKMSESAQNRRGSSRVAQRNKERDLSKRLKTRLIEEKVSRIKERLWSGDPISVVARDNGYLSPRVASISTGASWSHVPWPIGPRQAPRTRDLMSANARGRVHRPETIERMRAGHKSRVAAKLNEDLVRHIRLRKAGGESYSAIAQALNMSPKTVSNVCRGRSWKQVV